MAQELQTREPRRVVPHCSIREEEGKVVLILEMPGVEKDSVTISVDNDELKVSGKRSPRNHEGRYLLRERTLADYYSSYTLDDTIDRERIEAETTAGLLIITMHLTEASKPRQIAVKEVD